VSARLSDPEGAEFGVAARGGACAGQHGAVLCGGGELLVFGVFAVFFVFPA